MSVHLFVYVGFEARDILLAKQCSVCFDAYLICAFALILKVARSTLTRRVSDLLFCFFVYTGGQWTIVRICIFDLLKICCHVVHCIVEISKNHKYVV